MKSYSIEHLKKIIEQAKEWDSDWVSFDEPEGYSLHRGKPKITPIGNCYKVIPTPRSYEEDIDMYDWIWPVHYIVVECKVQGYGLVEEWGEGTSFLAFELKPLEELPDWHDDSDYLCDFHEVSYESILDDEKFLNMRFNKWKKYTNKKVDA